MLEVQDMNVYYGNIHAVKGVSFSVNKGEIVALVGANGAGKTTVLKTVSGLLKSKTGSIVFSGKIIRNLSPECIVKFGLSHVPEGRKIFSSMTVIENLEIGGFIKPKNIRKNIDKVYKLFPRLEERCNQPAGTLSGGEQQMLAIGRALMSEPKFLMMDEPSMGLAPLLIDKVFEIILQLKDIGITVLVIEQNAAKALSIADNAYVLEVGRIVLQGQARELLKDDSVKRAYLGE